MLSFEFLQRHVLSGWLVEHWLRHIVIAYVLRKGKHWLRHIVFISMFSPFLFCILVYVQGFPVIASY